MRIRVALLLAAATVSACSKNPEPQPPAPIQVPDTVGQGQRALDAARADSIARAEAERRRMAAESATAAREILTQRIQFDYDASRVRPDAESILRRKADVLRANPNVELEITGHADERGSLEYNLALGLRRASSVREFLANFGVDAGRLGTETAGEDRPLDPASSETAWALNRRAEFRITRGGDNLVMPGN
jgi:peptidoglycan-associated lipoprotein